MTKKELEKRTSVYDELIDYLKTTIDDQNIFRNFGSIMDLHELNINDAKSGKTRQMSHLGMCFTRGYAIGSGAMAIALQRPELLIQTGISAGTALYLYRRNKVGALKDSLSAQKEYAQMLQSLSEEYNKTSFPFDASNNQSFEDIVNYLKKPAQFHNGARYLEDDAFVVQD